MKLLQINLLSMMLFVATLAAWLATWKYSSETSSIEQKIEQLSMLVRVVDVLDPSQLAVVSQPVSWPSRCEWEIYVPASQVYHLVVAVRRTTVHQEAAWDMQTTVLLPEGQYPLTLDFEAEPAAISIALNGKVEERVKLLSDSTRMHAYFSEGDVMPIRSTQMDLSDSDIELICQSMQIGGGAYDSNARLEEIE